MPQRKKREQRQSGLDPMLPPSADPSGLEPVLPRPGFVNSIGMKLVLVPAGRFLMGSPKEEEDHSGYEAPRHEVIITRPFHLGAFPVTQEQYKHVMGRNPSHFKTRKTGGANP